MTLLQYFKSRKAFTLSLLFLPTQDTFPFVLQCLSHFSRSQNVDEVPGTSTARRRCSYLKSNLHETSFCVLNRPLPRLRRAGAWETHLPGNQKMPVSRFSWNEDVDGYLREKAAVGVVHCQWNLWSADGKVFLRVNDIITRLWEPFLVKAPHRDGRFLVPSRRSHYRRQFS